MAGRAPGSRNATPEEIDAGLTALARLGDVDAAAAELGISPRTLYDWRQRNPGRYAKFCEAFDSAREMAVRRAARLAAESIAADIPHLTQLLADADLETRLKAWDTLGRIFAKVDTAARLDARTPTSISGDEDPRTDAELREAARRWWAQTGVPEEYWPSVLRDEEPAVAVQ